MARAASGRLRQEAYSLCCSITHMREGREFPNVTVVSLRNWREQKAAAFGVGYGS